MNEDIIQMNTFTVNFSHKGDAEAHKLPHLQCILIYYVSITML